MSFRNITCAVVVCDWPDCERTLTWDGDSILHCGRPDGTGLDYENADLWLAEDDSWTRDGDLHYCTDHETYDEENDEYVIRVPEMASKGGQPQ